MAYTRATIVLAALLAGSAARATTYQVGAGQTYAQLTSVAALLQPGDVVLVAGNATYDAVAFHVAGTAAKPITIQGIPVAGHRPIISGGVRTVDLAGDHYVLEGFELTGGSMDCIFHEADDITLSDLVVHDCPVFGLLGSDEAAGSLTLQYSEFYDNAPGGALTHHQIYMTTSHVAHPGATFRMQFCYVHDGLSGNNVKSRAERNEIYYNWIEKAYYHELELIGADPSGGDTYTPRNSDVVGNVLWANGLSSVVRFGGDGTGDGSKGLFRAVNNTIYQTSGSNPVFWLFSGIESVEMHDNAIYVMGGGAAKLYDDGNADWVAGQQIAGSYNAYPAGSTAPTTWTQSIVGMDPKFTDSTNADFTLLAGSPLIDAGSSTLTGPPGHTFPSPLAVPAYMPKRALQAVGSAVARPVNGTIDVGAFEYGPPAAQSDGGSVVEQGDGGTTSGHHGGCSLEGSAPATGAAATALVLLGMIVALRRRPSHRKTS